MEYRREPAPGGKGLGLRLSCIVHGEHGIMLPWLRQALPLVSGCIKPSEGIAV
jgi:hypothetical protein